MAKLPAAVRFVGGVAAVRIRFGAPVSAIRAVVVDDHDHRYAVARRGLVDGNAAQVLNQGVGAGIAIVLAAVGTIIILKVCDLLVGVRVDTRDEITGLDLSMHGEEAYNLES